MKITFSFFFIFIFSVIQPNQAVAYALSAEKNAVNTAAPPLSIQPSKNSFVEKLVLAKLKKSKTATLWKVLQKQRLPSGESNKNRKIVGILSLLLMGVGIILGLVALGLSFTPGINLLTVALFMIIIGFVIGIIALAMPKFKKA